MWNFNRYKTCALGLIVLQVALLLTSASVHNPIDDELAHLPCGIMHWKTGDRTLHHVNPPLIRMVTALPVMALYPDLVPDVPAASLLLEIRDNGLSQTILAGEKCLIGRKPASGGDEKTLYMGHDDVITRSVRNAILATRTLKHFQDTDLSLVNPWGLSGSI